MMQKVSRISLCVVIGLLFLALIWKFAGAQLAKKGIVLSNDTAAKTVSETAPEAEDGSGNAGIKKLAETTPPNETPGWQYSSSGWWYATDATTYYVNGWADIDGNQYHFDSNGYMATGWKAIGGKGCYFDDQGVYQPDRNGSMMVALTFDDGPDVYTGELLDTLERYGAQATFFMLGSNVEKYGADTISAWPAFAEFLYFSPNGDRSRYPKIFSLWLTETRIDSPFFAMLTPSYATCSMEDPAAYPPPWNHTRTGFLASGSSLFVQIFKDWQCSSCGQ